MNTDESLAEQIQRATQTIREAVGLLIGVNSLRGISHSRSGAYGKQMHVLGLT